MVWKLSSLPCNQSMETAMDSLLLGFLLNMLKHLIRILMTMLCDFIISAQMCDVMHSPTLISFPINHLCTLWGVFMIGSQTFQLSHEFDLIAIWVVFFFKKANTIFTDLLLRLNCWCSCSNEHIYVFDCRCVCLPHNYIGNETKVWRDLS